MTDSYTELRLSSAMSFLQASSTPEELANEAGKLGYKSLALADFGGVYGIPRFVKACMDVGVRPIVGAKLHVDMRSVFASPRPEAQSQPPEILLLCETEKGYENLCELLTEGHATQEKGECVVDLQTLERLNEGIVALVGGREGPLFLAKTKEEAYRALLKLVSIFGRSNIFVDIQRHNDPEQEHKNRLVMQIAESLNVRSIATNDVRYHKKERGRLFDCFTAIRRHQTLDDCIPYLEKAHMRYLETPRNMVQRFHDFPELLRNTQELSERLAFSFSRVPYRFPRFTEGDEFQLLRDLVAKGIKERYKEVTPKVENLVNHELDVIKRLELAGYFLLVWDIVRFCKENGILAQGRGSAANSIVCYALYITAIDPVAYDLLFERFLSEERGEWPDIDLDLPSGDAREKVIQYVYEKYGRRSVGMTATFITYRQKGAIREMGKVFGLDPARIEKLADMVANFEFPDEPDIIVQSAKEVGLDLEDRRVSAFLWAVREAQDLPRHLSQHNGGLVICGGRLDRVVPLEPARMKGRTVIQWDKEDLADLRIIKVDLLGLGMLSAISDALKLVERHYGAKVELASIPPDDKEVFQMLQKADTVGVFQVESRAQMAILPRMKPERFYDLVVEVAIVRPGPIVGEMVNPYLRRRMGKEKVTYAHPCLRPILERTLGVPLFQEQVMRIAMSAAGFTAGEAEALRRAMGSRRSVERMQMLVGRLREGMTKKGIDEKAQEQIVQAITSFAKYGFPESHAASFALIAYASAWLKVHYKEAFYVALLNNWPMGFYTPATLVRDAQRHGVIVRSIDIASSMWECALEEVQGEEEGRKAVRLGLKFVKGLSRNAGMRIIEERGKHPFESVSDLVARTGLLKDEVLALAECGALACLGKKRRDAMWQALQASVATRLLRGALQEETEENLPSMTGFEEVVADYVTTGVSCGTHPVSFFREALSKKGVISACELESKKDGERVKVCGMVIVRQRPGTAKGMFFATLEDETGLINVAVTKEVFESNRHVLTVAGFLVVEGVVQKRDGVLSVLGKRFEPLDVQSNKSATEVLSFP
jgi:error-prone DNA polymerase